jgi:hypothetical protein
MNLITDTWKGLLKRKLWPVALLLAGALVAVPLLLAKNPEPMVAAANAGAVSKDDAMPATFVSAANAEPAGDAPVKRRRTLGASKDPFEPAPLPKAKKSKKKKAAKADATATPTATEAPKTDAGSGGSGTPPSGAVPTATPIPKVTVPAFSVKVRFGSTADEDLATSIIERLSVLPDEENPLVVYRGVDKSGKAAIFELTGDVVAEGDGDCEPTPENCQYVKLRAGETEFITLKTAEGDDATAGQFELDVVKIYKKQTKVAAAEAEGTSTQSLAKVSSSSLKGKGPQLRRRNRYVFDATTGTLRLAKKGARTPISSL